MINNTISKPMTSQEIDSPDLMSQMVEEASDSNLLQQVDSVISASPYLARRKLRYEAEEGRVVLRGVVDTYFQKQMAQEAVRRIDGVEEIENRLEVEWS